jgi:ribosomal-protein-alanine N-acetyltransferase
MCAVTFRDPFHSPLRPEPQEVGWLASTDHPMLARQMEGAAFRHVHLDWQTLPELLNGPDFRCRVTREGTFIRAAMGATIHSSRHFQDRAAWLRLILPGDSAQVDHALDMAWDALYPDLAAEDVGLVSILMLDPWAELPCQRWGFTQTNAVITLRRDSTIFTPPVESPYRIREVTQADIEAVADVDSMAFEPVWHHDATALGLASRQAVTFTLIEDDERILGYQLSTRHIDTGHLARLAIRPEMQGRGLGGMLVGGMLRFFAERDIQKVTVNTQADNVASQRLYRRLGFQPVGHSVPCWTIKLK